VDDLAGVHATASLLDHDRAGFWRRFVAAFIDGLALGVVQIFLDRVMDDLESAGAGLVVAAAYFTYFHGRTGQSPGDAALGIKVIDFKERTGLPVGYPRAFLRWLVSAVSLIVLLLGYLWMLWDDEKQTWHDKAAGSVVVKVGYE
jgi:uncharacterized RDD family membrane protein YckC